ncbi:uncharacterized protein LOC119349250 [Triticum dicoccoides]|uniref:F-box domain-containing protein n=1 Tax=Triticum turgidum subsp. durum TaxID=4567 RepID=A0A9R0R2V2_TRITD|nr:uncharacterized protein LOC119349250 [Triticum dicoccoides]VAH21869.1 unnamed protein product [Triticum turgidum subsp. durum]
MPRIAAKLPRRRRRLCADEDRLGDLPDDLLLDILRRLDTRTALGAAALSRRWASLPREVPVLDLKVSDILPPRYHRCFRLREDARDSKISSTLSDRRLLEAITARYERRAMRSMVCSLKSLLASQARRRVERLSLEVFAYSTSACINRLVVDAVDSWGVRDLEVVATPTGPLTRLEPSAYSFPLGLISRKPGESRLRSLKLANCLPPPLRGFNALTTLVLRDLPVPTPAAAYEEAVAACPQLQVLHILSCEIKITARRVVLDAPKSEIRELVLGGELVSVEIRSLPKLESLASQEATVLLCSAAAAPCLAHVSLAFSVGRLEGGGLAGLNRSYRDFLIQRLVQFFQGAITVKDLVLRFTGPEMWIMPENPFSAMANLRRLLVADVPSSWDASWPRLLIETAPLLESLYVHVSHSEGEPRQEVPGETSASRHYHLKELVVIGFQRTERQMRLVRFTVEVSTALRRVALLKQGRVEDKGSCCDWEVVSQQSAWCDEERLAVLDGIGCSTGQIEVVLS